MEILLVILISSCVSGFVSAVITVINVKIINRYLDETTENIKNIVIEFLNKHIYKI